MYQMTFRIQRANGAALDDDDVAAVLAILRPKLAADPSARLHTYALQQGVFVAEADVSESLTQAQFQGFVDDLLPAAAIGWVSVRDDRQNPIFDATIPASGDVTGKTHPPPPPRETTWSVARK